MPLWLLKFTPAWGFIKKYWKIVAVLAVALIYTLFVFNAGYDKADGEWEAKEAARVEQELKEEVKAAREAAELKRQQDAQAEAAREQLRLEKEAAEERAAQARAEAATLRRVNDAKTKLLMEAQAADPSGPDPLSDGVRDILRDGQDRVRSARQP